jgi:acetylornithine deacetylase
MMIDKDYTIRTLADMIRIDSTNPSLTPGSAGEAEMATCVSDALRKMGLEVYTHEHEPGRFSVVGIRRGQGTGRSIMLNAHMDTVGVEGMTDPFSADLQDGRMYGRGAQDMKGSLAACMGAVKALCDAGTPVAGDVLIAAVADEEYASIGTADIAKRYPVNAAIVTEPTDLNLCLAHKGFVWLEVEAQGRAAHGSRFEDGIDANMQMGRVLAALHILEQDLRARRGHPLTGPPSLHISTIQGGTEWSVYSDHCTMRIERRTTPGETVSQAVAEIQEILDSLKAEDPTFRATLKTIFSREPFEVSPSCDLVRALETSATQILGQKPNHVGSAGWMDSALLSVEGVETVIIGPRGDGLHTHEEWVELNSVIKLADILARTVVAYSG